MKQAVWHIHLLIGILLLASAVRLIGPLRDVALGQTDAYSHLQFLKDWLAEGRLRHPYYPAGYYWVLAGPTRWFGWDPYAVVRFGGAFFGAGLVLSAYFLSRHVWSLRVGLWAAFLIGAFPAFHWLQKTGVGVYPSQLGLMLLPVILLSWNAVLKDRIRWPIPLLMGTVALLGWSVPMMLLDLLPFLGIDLFIRSWRRELPVRPVHLGLILTGLVGVGMATLLLMGDAGERLVQIAAAVSDLALTGDAPIVELSRIIWIYLVPLRLWPGSGLTTAAAFLVGTVLTCITIHLWRQGAAARMMALWALYAWAQTIFGVFQFQLYWRAGWVLLLAMALLGGWLLPVLTCRWLPGWRRIAYGAVLGSAVVNLVCPPAHHPHLSAAENDLVGVLRALERWSRGDPVDAEVPWLEAIRNLDHVVVWSRAYTSFDQHQGDPVHAFLERQPRITIQTIESNMKALPAFNPSKSHLILLDDHADIGTINTRFMRIVNPDLVQSFERAQQKQVEGARRLREHVMNSAEENWNALATSTDQGLDLLVLIPASAVDAHAIRSCPFG